jgi:hypothetical protein
MVVSYYILIFLASSILKVLAPSFISVHQKQRSTTLLMRRNPFSQSFMVDFTGKNLKHESFYTCKLTQLHCFKSVAIGSVMGF